MFSYAQTQHTIQPSPSHPAARFVTSRYQSKRMRVSRPTRDGLSKGERDRREELSQEGGGQSGKRNM